MLHVTVPFAPTCSTCPTELVLSYVPIARVVNWPPVFAPNIKSPSEIALSKPLICSVSETISNEVLSTFTDKVLPDLARPFPAVTWPAPENCENESASEPIVAVPVIDVNT